MAFQRGKAQQQPQGECTQRAGSGNAPTQQIPTQGDQSAKYGTMVPSMASRHDPIQLTQSEAGSFGLARKKLYAHPPHIGNQKIDSEKKHKNQQKCTVKGLEQTGWLAGPWGPFWLMGRPGPHMR